MSLETWLAFAAVSAAFLASPNRVTFAVMSQALARGPGSILATLPVLALGMLFVSGITLLALAGLLNTVPEILDPVRWLGPGFLLLVLIRLWRPHQGRAPLADNDNLPERKPLRIMRHAFVVIALDRWNYVFSAALLTQFLRSGTSLPQEAATLVGIFLALALVVWIAAAFGAQAIHRHMRRRLPRRVTSRRHDPVLIASASVTAGYRKLAA